MVADMIVSTYTSTRSPVQLLCINGDRIEVSYKDLARFLTAPNFVIFLLTYSIILVVMDATVYGVETTTWFRTIFWPLNSAFIGLLYAGAFWYCEYLARTRQRNYLIFSLGIHTITVLIAVPLGALLIDWLHGAETLFGNLHLWDFLKAILIASTFEFAVVIWIWPAELASWEREAADEINFRDMDPEILREHLETDLQEATVRLPYFTFN